MQALVRRAAPMPAARAQERQPAAPATPVVLDPSLLRQVAGGAPKGTWVATADSRRAPKGTW
jgi:hypothetical protein